MFPKHGHRPFLCRVHPLRVDPQQFCITLQPSSHLAVSLGALRGRVEDQDRLVDATFRRVCAVEAMTTTSRAWQCEAEAAIKSILEKVDGGKDE